MRGLIVLIIGFISTCLLQAQTIIDPVQLTIEDGLSQGFISCLHQDQEGFLWIGTKNGLNRYDGRRFEIFSKNRNNPYAIANDAIEAITEEGDYLIIRTKGTKLQLLHKPTKRCYSLDLRPETENQNFNINAIHKDQSGVFWINTTAPKQLIKATFPSQFWKQAILDTTRLTAVETNMVLENGQYISALNDTTLLVEINDQKALLHTRTSKTERLPAAHPTSSLDQFKLFRGQLGIGFTASSNQITLFQDTVVKRLDTDIRNPNFFYDADMRELWLKDFDTEQVFVFSLDILLHRNAIRKKDARLVIPEFKAGMIAWLKDRSGNIWLGTGGYGLLKISPRALKIKHFAVGQSISLKPTAHTLNEILFKQTYKRNDYIYTANEKGRLADIYQFLLGVKEDGFYLVQDKNLNYWLLVRQSKGIVQQHEAILYQFAQDGKMTEQWRYDGGGNCYMTYNPNKTALLITVDNHLFIYDTHTGTTTSYPMRLYPKLGNGAPSIVQTQNGQIWMATPKGLIQLQQNGKEVLFDTASSGLLDNNCASLLLDSKDGNVIWIGTKGGGLHRLDTKTLEFQYLNSSNGLPNDVIYGVLNDEAGNLWMSSNKGIIRYKPSSGAIRNFTVEDGMQSNEFNTNAYSKAFDGSLLFGGINGLNVFRPEDLVDNPHTPNVRITKLEVNNQSIAPLDSTQILTKAIEFTDEIVLPFSKNNVTLEFAALEFTASNKNKYRYYLEGIESEWQHETNDNRAAYLNLPSGRHPFRIKAANGDGVWSENVTELWIIILPPWYRTWWAYSGYLLLLIGSIGLFILFLQHRLKMQHKIELEQKEAERLRELDSFRSKLYTNITHEFRTPLTVMLGTNQQLAVTENNPERRRKFGLIKRNGNNLLDLVNQLLDLSKVEHNELTVNYVQGDLLKYVRYITESFYSLANVNNVLLQVESKEGEIIMDYDPIKIQQILSNLISNAIKYTPSGGKVTVSLALPSKEMLEILVRDTGKGISAADLPHIFNRFYQANDDVAKAGGTGIGLALTQELVKLLKGSIQVESQLGKGTTFTLQLPISKQANFERAVQITSTAPLPLMPYFQEEQIRQDKKEHRLLIIEDNPDVVEYLTTCLKQDYQLSYAYNGQAGIEKALELIPDLIISDVMMPEKTGFEVTETLKNNEKTSHIPIVLLTAKADIESKLSGLKRGADVYLAKPFHQEELLVQLRNLLQIRLKLQARYQALDQTLESQTESIQQEDVFITKIRQIVEENLDNEQFDVSALCKAIGMSRSQLHHKLKALTNRSTSHYVRSIRLHKAKIMLEKGHMTVSEVSYAVGYRSRSYFSRAFLEEFGYSPSDLLEG